MACRISSAHVCQIAKSVVQQAKDTSANHLLKPGSREISRVRHKKKEISPEKYPSKECQRESPRKTNSDAEAQLLTGEFKKKDARKTKSKPSDNINDMTPSSIFEYFRKLYDEEETKRLFLHLQPNNIQPFGSGSNQYTPALFKRRSSSADCQYFSKNVAEKIGYCGKLTTSQSNYVDFRSNTNNVKVHF
ncbi:hypothetical protein WA026_020729 [Henosepilachna vigintioctopunctata]|uniref:Uncharacterized protein n=1 Tax=Henosepilachna vigintioctopunctata TaxID=420089 RepID=A0AAW1UDV6_9CUCU